MKLSKKITQQLSVLGIASLALGSIAIANNTLIVEAAGNIQIANNSPEVVAAVCLDGAYSGVNINPGQSHNFTNLTDGDHTIEIIDYGPNIYGGPGGSANNNMLNLANLCSLPDLDGGINYPEVTAPETINVINGQTAVIEINGGSGTNGQPKTLNSITNIGVNQTEYVGVRAVDYLSGTPVTSFCIDGQVRTSPTGDYPITVNSLAEASHTFDVVQPNGGCPANPLVTASIGIVGQTNITFGQYNYRNNDFAYGQPVTLNNADAAVTGALDSVTDTGAAVGWSYDPSDPNVSVLVHIYINDQLVGTSTADEARGDVQNQYGLPMNLYGYNYQIPQEFFTGNPIKVDVYGIDATGGQNTLLGTQTITLDPAAEPEPVIDPEPQPEPEPVVDPVDNNVDLTQEATVPSAVEANETITVVFNEECADLDYYGSLTEGEVADNPDYDFPRGLVSFSVNCDVANVDLYWSNLNEAIIGTNTVKLLKYGPQDIALPDNKTWFEMPATVDYVTIDGIDYLKTSYTINDNQLGDANPAAGIILDPIGLVLEPQQVAEPVENPVDAQPVQADQNNVQLPVTGAGDASQNTPQGPNALFRSGGSRDTINTVLISAFVAIAFGAIYLSFAENSEKYTI